jgi:hypothetical protein
MYDFRTLSPLDFEELVRDLLQAEFGVRFESFGPGRDQGIDFRFATGHGGAVVQAKHYVDSGFAPLLRVCRAEDAKVITLRASRYVLATSVSLTPLQKSKIREAMSSAPLVEDDIFGQADLNNLLGRHPKVERKHFKLWLASTVVLERILHSGVYNRTETEMGLIKTMTSRFVHNDSVPAAEAILEKSGALIISGEPGVGKTTLARMLVWLHAEQGWRISVIDDIREAFEVPVDGEKRLIFFDDFLGQVALSNDLVRGMDQRFPPFLQKVRTHKNLRFVLTTRDYILRQAQALSGRLAAPAVDASQFVLNVGHYTRSVRAKMLYNHLYFSEMAKTDIGLLLEGDFFLKIIDHRNFNPRLVDLLTSPDYLALAGKPIRSVVEAVLDNPLELWERPYRTHMSHEARALMLSLFFNSQRTRLDDLEQTFERMLDATGSAMAATERPAAFRRTLKELEGSVLAIQSRAVRFSNPGIRDFLNRIVEDDRLLLPAVRVLCDYDELKQCWGILAKSSAAKNIPARLIASWSEAMGRMVVGSSGTALECLELVVESYDATKDPALLEHVVVAIAVVNQSEVDETEVDRCRNMIDQSVLTLLPSEVAEELRAAVSSAVARMLRDCGGLLSLDDVESVAQKLLQYGKDDAEVRGAIRAALVAQIAGIDVELDSIDTLDDLDEFESRMDALLRKHGVIDKRIDSDIESRREKILDGRVHAHRGHYGSSVPAGSDQRSNDEIRSMFRELLR